MKKTKSLTKKSIIAALAISINASAQATTINSGLQDSLFSLRELSPHTTLIVEGACGEGKCGEGMCGGKKPDSNQQEQKAPETNQADTKPTEVKPAEVKPAEVKPPEINQPEAKPVESKPPEVKPFETKPVETKPTGTEKNTKLEIKDTKVKPGVKSRKTKRAKWIKFGLWRYRR